MFKEPPTTSLPISEKVSFNENHANFTLDYSDNTRCSSSERRVINGDKGKPNNNTNILLLVSYYFAKRSIGQLQQQKDIILVGAAAAKEQAFKSIIIRQPIEQPKQKRTNNDYYHKKQQLALSTYHSGSQSANILSITFIVLILISIFAFNQAQSPLSGSHITTETSDIDKNFITRSESKVQKLVGRALAAGGRMRFNGKPLARRAHEATINNNNNGTRNEQHYIAPKRFRTSVEPLVGLPTTQSPGSSSSAGTQSSSNNNNDNNTNSNDYNLFNIDPNNNSSVNINNNITTTNNNNPQRIDPNDINNNLISNNPNELGNHKYNKQQSSDINLPTPINEPPYWQRNVKSINGTIDIRQYEQSDVDRLYGDALLVYVKNFNE